MLEGTRLATRRTPDDWCEVEASAAAGADYGFSLDGGPVLPDPRSAWQPAGVDGLSRVVDHGAFPWTDGGWRGLGLEAAVIYEIHVGALTPAGTFESAIDRLDHMVELGATHVEVMPVAEFTGHRGWGYDGVDLYAPHHAYGGPDGLKRLVDACHARRLGVILDVVYNHLGQEGDHLSKFGRYLRQDLITDWGLGFDVDGANAHEVRSFLIDNAVMWLRDYHLDGLRLDASDRIHDTSPVHLLAEMSARVAELAGETGRRLILVAENDMNDPVVVTPRDGSGWGLDAQWVDDFQHALHALVTGERQGYYQDFGTVADLATALTQAYVYSGRQSTYHGVVRGKPAGDAPGTRFVVFAQNHDQVGNRPRGERLSQLVDPERQRLSAAVLMLSPYVPLLFMGDEWAASTPFLFFADHREQWLRDATRAGRRRDLERFGWSVGELPDPEAVETFRASKLDWEELKREPHSSMLAWYQSLISLRRSTPELSDGRRDLARVAADDDSGHLELVRGRVRLECDFRAGRFELSVS